MFSLNSGIEREGCGYQRLGSPRAFKYVQEDELSTFFMVQPSAFKATIARDQPSTKEPIIFHFMKMVVKSSPKSAAFLSWHVHSKMYVKFAVPNVNLMATPVQIVTRQKFMLSGN